MRFTPFHNWPVAEDTDVVKQYPATIDQPFKDELDPITATAAMNMDQWGGQISFPSTSLRFGTYGDATDGNGIGTIIFKPAFPNTCLYAIICLGTSGPSFVTPAAYGPANFQVQFFNAAGGIWANSNFTLNYIAIGW